jgi:hypothetical protein
MTEGISEGEYNYKEAEEEFENEKILRRIKKL